MAFLNFFQKINVKFELEQAVFLITLFLLVFSSAIIQLPEMIFLLAFFCIANFPYFTRRPSALLAIFAMSNVLVIFPKKFEHIITPAEITLPVLLFCVLWIFLKNRKVYGNIFSKQSILFAGLAFLAGIGILWSTNQAYGTEKFTRFIALVVPLFFAPAFIELNETSIKNLLSTFFAALLGLSLGLIAYSLLFSTPVMVAANGVVTANALISIFFVSGFAIGVFYFFQSSSQSFKIFFGISAILFFILVILIASLGPFLAFLPILFLLIVRFSKGKKTAVYLAVFAIVCGFFLLFILPNSLQFISPENLPTDPGIVSRTVLYNAGWKMFLQKPLLGWGFGSFKTTYLTTLSPEQFDLYKDSNIQYSHNIYLDALSELGIIGFMFLALFTLIIFLKFFQCNKISSNPIEKNLLFLVFLLFLAGLLEAQTSFEFSGHKLLWLGAGILAFWPKNFETKTDKKTD